jgi:hypothetical protein
MTVAEFLAWSEDLPDEARYELVAGVPLLLMAPTNIRHAQIQANASQALRRSLAEANLRCRVYDAGPGVAVCPDGDECRIPDVVVTCATEIDETARCRAVYHGRGPGGGLEPRIVRAGEIAFDPPGIRLALDDLYRETEIAAS